MDNNARQQYDVFNNLTKQHIIATIFNNSYLLQNQ